MAGLVATGKFELEYGKPGVQILLKLANLDAQYVQKRLICDFKLRWSVLAFTLNYYLHD